MAKFTVAAVIGCVYVAGSVWLVQSQGESYRQALRAARRATPTPVAAESSPLEPKSAGDAEIKTAADPPFKPAAQPPATAPTEIAATNAQQPRPEVDPKPTPAPEPPAPVAPSIKQKAPPVVQAPARVRDWADSLNLGHLTAANERRLGLELHQRILARIPRFNEGPWLQQVETAAAPLLDARSRKDVEYTFTILDSDAVNAFSHPGGFVYVCRGLFDLIGDEDYALQFVLGHEIAHVDMMHAVKVLEGGNAAAKERGFGTLQQFDLPIMAAYPDAMEFKADEWAFRRMLVLGRTRHEALAFLRKFKSYAERRKLPNGHQEPERNSLLLENHFRAHTAAWKRLERLQKIAD